MNNKIPSWLAPEARIVLSINLKKSKGQEMSKGENGKDIPTGSLWGGKSNHVNIVLIFLLWNNNSHPTLLLSFDLVSLP